MINSDVASHTHRSAVLFLILTLVVSSSVFGAASSVVPAKSMADVLKTIKASGAKVIWLNVWATECSPCMAEMPVLVRLAGKFKRDANVAFVGLCLPSDVLALKKDAMAVANAIVKKKELPYPNLVWLGSGDALQEKFNIQGTPYNALLSPDGKILSEVDVPGDETKASEVIESAIAKALKESPTK